MKNIYIKTLVILIILYFPISCTKVIDVTVPNGGERLVIEASIIWEKGTTGNQQIITLSKSTEYFTQTPFVPAIGANVVVLNNTSGETFIFQDQNDGTYTVANFVPVINNSYTLDIVYNGETYSGTEKLVSVSKINDVEQKLTSGFGEDEIQLKAYFDDPVSIQNYYMGIFIPSHKPLRNLSTLDDEFSNGNKNFIEYDDQDLTSGDIVDIQLHGISENYYNYITQLENQNGDGGPFSTTPAKLKGNCININNKNEEVLGYFRLSEVDKRSFTIN